MKYLRNCLLTTVLCLALLVKIPVLAMEAPDLYFVRDYVEVAQNTDEEKSTQANDQAKEQPTETDEAQPSNLEEENAAAGTEAPPAVALSIQAPSSILMEASTGKVIYESNPDERMKPASITKIMTLMLIFEALDSKKINLTDNVTTSEHAKSMGGSQVFLETGEVQTVDTLIKCITVASGNDASVAMAEYIAGSEEEFVNMMNQKAQKLGMENTHFEDCCGLTDSDNHYSSARDVAVMSRELTLKHPEVFNYTQIWMEDIVHNTAKGSSTFTLSSTNKLLKQYEYATGLKTGSTSSAKFCLSATATRDNIDLIAVVMKAPDPKVRFQDAATLLNYGFSVSRMYHDKNKDALPLVVIKKGVKEKVPVQYKSEFNYLDTTGANLEGVEKIIEWKDTVEAPVEKGQIAGIAKYTLNGKELGSVDILFSEDVVKAVYKDYVKKVMGKFLL